MTVSSLLFIVTTTIAIAAGTAAMDNCTYSAVKTHRGREFLITYPELFHIDNNMSIYLTSLHDGSATLTSTIVPNSTYIINAGNVRHVDVKTRLLTQYSLGRQTKYIFIRATVDIAVYVSGYVDEDAAAAFLVMPVDVMASHYVVASYEPYNSIYNDAIVTAMQANTNVTVALVNGVRKSFVLDCLESYNLRYDFDLSGTRIDSSKPVSVIVGNACAMIPKDVYGCDPLLDSPLPVSRWDTVYIVPAMYLRSGYLIRVFTKATTNVTYYNDTSRLETQLVAANTHLEIMAGTLPTVIISDQPVMVVQYGLGGQYDSTHGDPFMVTVPSIRQYDADYIFPTALGTSGFANTLVVTVEMAYKTGLRLDGRPMRGAREWAVYGPFGAYAVIAVNVNKTNTVHLLTHTTADVTYGAMLYGLFGRNAGFPLGIRLSDVQCMNGGQNTDRHCVCPDGYTGTCCETAVSSSTAPPRPGGCLSSPCYSGSTCIDTPDGGYLCRCRHGYTGRGCSTALLHVSTTTPPRVIRCLFSPCYSGSTCIETPDGGYRCLCRHGYTGPDCSTVFVAAAITRGPACFACKDTAHQRYCDVIKHCRADEVCYITKYHNREGHTKYRSGCINQTVRNYWLFKTDQTAVPQTIQFWKLCSSSNGSRAMGDSCLECCHGNYCNSAGCGELGVTSMGHHGPMCLDCAHVGNVTDCDQVTLCGEDEVCSIEQYDWGNEKNFKLGCINNMLCAPGTRRRLSPDVRSVPSCRSCCHDDFCNTKCTGIDPAFVG